MWQIIKNNQPSTSSKLPQTLNAEKFNDYFVSAADNVLHSLPKSTNDFKNYLKQNEHIPTFSFRPLTYNEVRDIIANLKNSKSRDCFDITTKIIKTLKNLIVYPLTKLINEGISLQKFPLILKKA